MAATARTTDKLSLKAEEEKNPSSLDPQVGSNQRRQVTMKIYVGNLGDDDLITAQDLKPLFEPYGTVTECEKIKNYA